jgi:hypothetical protein
MRVNAGQEFVIGGYTLGKSFDALVFGYYEGERLMYVARTRNGFTPGLRQILPSIGNTSPFRDFSQYPLSADRCGPTLEKFFIWQHRGSGSGPGVFPDIKSIELNELGFFDFAF